MRVALAGNPNCGKTSLFNSLTGAHQHVGNYPGVTVEKKMGHFKLSDGQSIEIVDLPGTYGLSPYSEDERVARSFLIEEKPDLILNVIDTSNIERHLFLTVQLIELNIPMLLVLNMVDTAKSLGIIVDSKKLATLIHLPIVETVGHKKEGVQSLMRWFEEHHRDLPQTPTSLISYGPEIDDLKQSVAALCHIYSPKHDPSWIALKLIENDNEVHTQCSHFPNYQEIKNLIGALEKHVKTTLDDSLENCVAGFRYGLVHSLASQCVDSSKMPLKTVSDYLDALFLNRFLGPILLFSVLWCFYQVVFTLGEPLVAILETGIAFLHQLAETHIPEGLLNSLVTSGIIDGVGGVLGFTPLIMLMFFMISILEDSGYMARMAFLLDRVLRFFGMHGNSILAFIVSGGLAGGCAVPGIMSTRTLKDPKERLATILTVPFMNCGAKLPVYSVFIAAFFSHNKGSMMFILTLVSWLVALIMAGFLRKTVLRGQTTPFVMELPPYRFPTWNGIFIHMWERTWLYIKKAGTFIVMASIIMWAMMTFPQTKGTSDQQLYNSFAGRVGVSLSKITEPIMGFDWQTNIALVAGLAAKEVVISTLGIAYSLEAKGQTSDQGEDEEQEIKSLSERIQAHPHWNPLKAFTFILFVMLYMPCISVIGVIYKETSSLKWSFFSVFYTTFVAFSISSLFYLTVTNMTK